MRKHSTTLTSNFSALYNLQVSSLCCCSLGVPSDCPYKRPLVLTLLVAHIRIKIPRSMWARPQLLTSECVPKTRSSQAYMPTCQDLNVPLNVRVSDLRRSITIHSGMGDHRREPVLNLPPNEPSSLGTAVPAIGGPGPWQPFFLTARVHSRCTRTYLPYFLRDARIFRGGFRCFAWL